MFILFFVRIPDKSPLFLTRRPGPTTRGDETMISEVAGAGVLVYAEWLGWTHVRRQRRAREEGDPRPGREEDDRRTGASRFATGMTYFSALIASEKLTTLTSTSPAR